MKSNVIKADYQTVLNQTGTLSFVPNGNSMWPFLKNGKQTVIIEKLPTTVKELDVVFFKRENGDYVLHRVVAVDGEKLTVRGDSQLFTESINKEYAFGIMTGFYKGKNLVLASDKKYIKKVEKWYKNGFFTRLKIKLFYAKLRFKQRIAKIVKGA